MTTHDCGTMTGTGTGTVTCGPTRNRGQPCETHGAAARCPKAPSIVPLQLLRCRPRRCPPAIRPTRRTTADQLVGQSCSSALDYIHVGIS